MVPQLFTSSQAASKVVRRIGGIETSRHRALAQFLPRAAASPNSTYGEGEPKCAKSIRGSNLVSARVVMLEVNLSPSALYHEQEGANVKKKRQSAHKN